jgi:hypothetical protein
LHGGSLIAQWHCLPVDANDVYMCKPFSWPSGCLFWIWIISLSLNVIKTFFVIVVHTRTGDYSLTASGVPVVRPLSNFSKTTLQKQRDRRVGILSILSSPRFTIDVTPGLSHYQEVQERMAKDAQQKPCDSNW